MFRQIWIAKDQQNYQRILWRYQKTGKIHHLKLLTVTYGTTSAPHQATSCILQRAIEIQDELPIIAELLRHNFYLDDYLGSFDTYEEASTQTSSVIQTLAEVGMPLRKIASNNMQLLENLPGEICAIKPVQLKIDETSIGTFGITWKPVTDEFQVSIWLGDSWEHLKRTLLAECSRVFDPL
jgi:hypothetical protein